MAGESSAETSCDAICAAAQIGRLDLISTLLAIIGILLALGGVFAFINLRGVAKRQAKEEATKIAEEIAERAANDYLIAELPALLRAYTELARNAASDEAADDIAEAQENGGEKP